MAALSSKARVQCTATVWVFFIFSAVGGGREGGKEGRREGGKEGRREGGKEGKRGERGGRRSYVDIV